MAAFLTNLSWGEIVVVAALAVLVFGKRLPQVAGQAFRNLARLRRRLDDLRRESGIDREILEVQHSLRDLQRDVEGRPAWNRPAPAERDALEPPPEAPPAPAAEAPPAPAAEAPPEQEDGGGAGASARS